jgi:hypothetical protein
MTNYRSPSPIPIQGGGSPYAAPTMLPGGSPYGAPQMLPGSSPYGGQMLLPNTGGVSSYTQPAQLSAPPYQSNFYGQQPINGLGVNGLTYDQQQVALSAPPGTVIIHSDSGRSHRHRHRSRSHSRHHSHRRRDSGGSYDPAY